MLIVYKFNFKDDIMELFTPSEDEDEPDDGQLDIEFIYD